MQKESIGIWYLQVGFKSDGVGVCPRMAAGDVMRLNLPSRHGIGVSISPSGIENNRAAMLSPVFNVFCSTLLLLRLKVAAVQVPMSSSLFDDTISDKLFYELEELSRIVDILYCVGTTGKRKRFLCASRCRDFSDFELISVSDSSASQCSNCWFPDRPEILDLFWPTLIVILQYHITPLSLALSWPSVEPTLLQTQWLTCQLFPMNMSRIQQTAIWSRLQPRLSTPGEGFFRDIGKNQGRKDPSVIIIWFMQVLWQPGEILEERSCRIWRNWPSISILPSHTSRPFPPMGSYCISITWVQSTWLEAQGDDIWRAQIRKWSVDKIHRWNFPCGWWTGSK